MTPDMERLHVMSNNLHETIDFPNVTIYDHPTDYPDQFVARKFKLDKPTDNMFADEDLEKVREWAQAQFGYMPHVLARTDADDPVILEVWF